MPDRIEERLQEWEGWLDRLRDDILTLNHDRELWDAVRLAIIERASDSPGNWLQHYTRLYANSQTSAVRRIIRSARGPDSITLGRVLEDVEQNAHLITVEWKVAQAAAHGEEGPWLDRARREFLERWRTVDGHLDQRQVRHDRRDLNRSAADVLDFANTVVAHITVDAGQDVNPTFDQLHAAIDHIGKVFQRYYALLFDVHQILGPAIQDPWKRTFSVPLFPGPGSRTHGSDSVLS